MVRRVAVYGPESTGKTQLAEALAAHFGEPWSPEYVRRFWDEHAGRIAAENLETIARGQMAGEEAAAAKARRVVFCDTELLTNVLWADLLFPGRCPDWVLAEAEARSRRYALYLFCDTDLPFAADPQRCFPDAAGRAMCRRLWRDTLVTRALPMAEIRGEGREREERAIAAVEKLMAGRA